MHSDTDIFHLKYILYMTELENLRKNKSLFGFFIAIWFMCVLRLKLANIRTLYKKGTITNDVSDIYQGMLKKALKI